MSQAARMQRAKDMGFDTDTVYYHGTTQHGVEGITKDGFDVGTYGGKGGSLLGDGVYLTPSKRYASKYGSRFHDYTKDNLPETAQMVGKDKNLVMPFYLKEGAISREAFGGKEVLVTDPSNIRSVNAAFDPAKKDSANLLAEAGTGVALGSMALPQGQFSNFMERRKARGGTRRQRRQAAREQAAMQAQEQAFTDMLMNTPTNYDNRDTIQGAQYPILGDISNTIRQVETPIGKPFEGAARWLDKINYGDDINTFDRLDAIPDPTEFSTLLQGLTGYDMWDDS